MSRPTGGGPLRLARWGALGTLAGFVLSGPAAVAFVTAVAPQPRWQGAEVFARHFHPVQMLPYAGGLVLVVALLVLLASLAVLAPEALRARAVAALLFAAPFAAFIFLNYVLQTTFVPVLARAYEPTDAALLGALSMSNPRSLAWGIEMWGWGFLGVATWLLAPVFTGGALERATAMAFVANGVVSVIGTLWTVARPGWVMTGIGLAMFAVWNLLLATMAVLALLSLGRRSRAGGDTPHARGVPRAARADATAS